MRHRLHESRHYFKLSVPHYCDYDNGLSISVIATLNEREAAIEMIQSLNKEGKL